MKCILHIGTEKTGTTSIQHFLLGNRKHLQQQGFYLLDSLRQPDNRYLAVAAMDASSRDGFIRNVLRFTTDEEVRTFQQKTIAQLEVEAKRLPKDCTVIISGEHLQSRLRSPNEVQHLHTILREVGFTTFQVIVYLRDPAATACSLYSTMIKGGRTDAEVPPPDDVNMENICHHQKTIEKFSAVFGGEYLTVRLFRKDRLAGGSVVHDFGDVLGLNMSDRKFRLPEKQNESLSAMGIQLLRKVNAEIPVYKNGQMTPERVALIRHLTTQYSNPPFALSAAQQQAYKEHFAASNQWVKAQFFPNESNLFPPTQMAQGKESISEAEFEQEYSELMNWWQTHLETMKSTNGKTERIRQTITRLAKRLRKKR